MLVPWFRVSNSKHKEAIMYGTVARFQVKPGSEEALRRLSSDPAYQEVPGWVGEIVYRSDSDPNEYYLAVVFESKEAYWANAQSPEQDARYCELRELMAADPEWHDGEVVEYNMGGK
jgi:quinol monooxygenase YgiN